MSDDPAAAVDPAAPVRPGEELDPEALEAYLRARLPGFAGPVEVRQFPRGFSNLTYLVRAGWKSNTIRPGDKVTVVGNPVRSGEPSAIFVSLTLADGRTLTERPARLGGPSASGRE